MAAFSETSKPACHLRSISLPSKKHPLVSIVEEQLDRLRASEATPSIAGNKLGGLKDLYENVDDLLQLPLAQQTLSHQNCKEHTEEILSGSLRILDVCGTTRDVFAQMKELVRELESSLRRRRGEESRVENEVRAFMVSRKRLSTMVSRCRGNSKKMEKSCKSPSSSSDKDLDLHSVLRQAEETILAVLESLLSHVSPPKTTGWSLVSKLTKSRKVSSEDQAHANEVQKMDTELQTLVGKKNSCPIRVQKVLEGLKALESNIQETEEELECVYRRLLKTRVSLLNTLQH